MQDPSKAPVVSGPNPIAALAQQAPDQVQETVQHGADAAVISLGPVWGTVVTVAVAVLGTVLVVLLVGTLAKLALHRRPGFKDAVSRVQMPVGLALGFLAARIGFALTVDEQEPWFVPVGFLLVAAMIVSVAWLAWRIVHLVERYLLHHYGSGDQADRRQRKIQTQTVLLRRVLEAAIVVIAIAVILMTIPAVRSLGAGLLASAGLLSVVVGLAVQSTLTNVFAGIQLAFTDSIRVGDVVDVQGTFGVIEDITLSNVVVKIWDGRRMVYPSSHFTTNAFENWTRVGTALSGVVEMDVDWKVPMEALRARLRALLESTELWDGKDCSMQVLDATGGMVRIRAVVSARNSGDLWDLRCLVREDFVKFIRSEYPEGIYATRMVPLEPGFGQTGGQAGDDDAATAAAADSSGRGGSSTRAEASGRTGAGERTAAGTGATDRPQTGPSSPATRVDRLGDDAASAAEPGTHAGHLPRVEPRTPAPRPHESDHGAAEPVARTGQTPLTEAHEGNSMFTGSITAVERNRELAGPGEGAYAERKERTEEATGVLPKVSTSEGAGQGQDGDSDGEGQHSAS